VLLHCYAGCTTAEVLAAAGLTWGDLFATPRRSVARPVRSLTPLVAARLELLEQARRQPWAREGVLDLYEAADAVRYADRVRRSVTVESDGGWELLAMAAQLTTDAEALAADA
jgi:hypothetical protein